jgi:hypothetical protein
MLHLLQLAPVTTILKLFEMEWSIIGINSKDLPLLH